MTKNEKGTFDIVDDGGALIESGISTEHQAIEILNTVHRPNKASLHAQVSHQLGKLSPSEKAKRVIEGLQSILEEHVREIKYANVRQSWSEKQLDLALTDKLYLEQAMELLKVLDAEQWRQREAIKLHLHSHNSHYELRQVSNSWNNDPNEGLEATEAQPIDLANMIALRILSVDFVKTIDCSVTIKDFRISAEGPRINLQILPPSKDKEPGFKP